MGDTEFAPPAIEILRRRPISRIGFNPETILRHDKDLYSGGDQLRAFVQRGERDRIIEVYNQRGDVEKKIAKKLESAPWIKRDPMVITPSSTPDSRTESYATAIHEAAHQGLSKLENEFGPGWLLAETELFRRKYGVDEDNVDEVIIRLIDHLNGVSIRTSDRIIESHTKITGTDLAERLLADPLVQDLITRLQGQADLQLQHEGRPEGATRFAGGSTE
jgi:hypothetical protein